MSEHQIIQGGAIKALGNGRLGGYAVTFGGPRDTDLEGDWFTEKTYLGKGDGNGRDVLFHHGLGIDSAGVEMSADEYKAVSELADRVVKGEAQTKRDPVGLFAEVVMDMNDRYEAMLYRLGEKGFLGWSTAVPPATVRRKNGAKAGEIERWIISEFTLTPQPAEPRNFVQAVKSLISEPAQPEAQAPEASEADAGNSAAEAQEPVPSTEQTAEQTPPEEITIMPDNNQVTERAPEQAAPVETNAFEAKLAQMETAFSAKIDAVLKALENEPAARKAGYVTDDGGAADTHVKSFGDWLLAVRRGDTKRLTTVYKSANMKDMGEDSGVMGGYTVPEEFMPRLLEAMGDTAVVRGRAEAIPVSSDAGFIPALDQFTAPTAGVGNTAFAGGVTADPALSGSEGGTLTETQPTFKKLEYRIHKIGDYVEVDSELIADSPLAIETLLTRLFGRAVAAKEDYYFLRGTGVGAPLGILNAPCAIGVDADSDNAWTDADALEMISRFRPNTNRCYWIMHPSMIPDLATFEVGTGGSVYLSDQSVRPGSIPLFGYPILFSEHLPQADTAGCVILADLGSYMIFDRQNLAIAYSEHVNFKSDQGVWRYTKRFDGKPWQISTITLADPQGSFTVSPFVYNND